MVQGMEKERMGMCTQEGPTKLSPFAQTNTHRTFIKENIEASRTLTGEHDQHNKIGENPKKLTCKEAFQMLVQRHQGIQRYEIDRPTSSRLTVLRCIIQKQHVIQRYEINRPTPSRVMVLGCSLQKQHVIQRYEINRLAPSRVMVLRCSMSYKDMKLIVRHYQG
ncbi:hypothetical protein Tco_0895628 [Tanacetum coccineum]|uniref:Uncharacterized protein n=1 Tax=Tanacetum coccineum TaxID=301880 RepID=A0ABQ5CF43_9ASTR